MFEGAARKSYMCQINVVLPEGRYPRWWFTWEEVGVWGEMSREGRMSGHTSGPAAHGMMYCWRRARASCVLATR